LRRNAERDLPRVHQKQMFLAILTTRTWVTDNLFSVDGISQDLLCPGTAEG
jgi:hypothetical protein